jgi:phospholipid/cholesterol/gamma-HCH transport system permease protein
MTPEMMAARAGAPASAGQTAATPRARSGFVTEVGAMVHMTGQVIRRGMRRPFDYGPELVEQFTFAVRLAWFPLILTSFALSFGPAGIQAVNFFGLFGSLDRLGGAYVIVVVRVFAPLVTAIVVAGVVGTAICADLGAREVREETDALAVLGIDPVKALVVPRFIALVVVSILFDIFSLLSGLAGAMVVVVQNHAELGQFFTTFFANATTLELGSSFVKSAIYGGMIAIVCCYKGMRASGGPEGVGRAVNQAVVITFLMIGALDYVFSQLILASFPELAQVR